MTEKEKIAQSTIKILKGFKDILDLHRINYGPSTNEYQQLAILESGLIDDMYHLIEIHKENNQQDSQK
ncbi:MAG: hypothetical protein ACI9GZ_001612 [Bacteroidia bacterium]|jgi:hypothetical protein